MDDVDILPAHGPEHLDVVRELFLEYQASLGVDLCFQGFSEELATLPGRYAPPSGRLFVAVAGASGPAGCIALRGLPDGRCEMKRLYVRPSHRALGLGRRLCDRVIADARSIGYRTMVLDTLPTMAAAQAMYERLGFRDSAPYTPNPVAGTRFMALDLSPL